MVSLTVLVFYGGAAVAVAFLVWVLLKLMEEGRN
jgi:hypothetical protein